MEHQKRIISKLQNNQNTEILLTEGLSSLQQQMRKKNIPKIKGRKAQLQWRLPFLEPR